MSQTLKMEDLEMLTNNSKMHNLVPSIALAFLLILKDCETHCWNEGIEVKNLGGLHVIGTSLHESRRIDNQVQSLYFLSFLVYIVFFINFHDPMHSFSKIFVIFKILDNDL